MLRVWGWDAWLGALMPLGAAVLHHDAVVARRQAAEGTAVPPGGDGDRAGAEEGRDSDGRREAFAANGSLNFEGFVKGMPLATHNYTHIQKT